MITINLLPQEFRVKEKVSIQLPWLKGAILAGGLVGVLTLWFYADFWMSKAKFAQTDKEWQFMQPQSQRLLQLEQEVNTKLKPENVFLNSFVTADKPLTLMMSWVNEFLPPTTWITELKMERLGEGGSLYIKGMTLPSKEKSSIEFIEIYLHQLKEKMPDADLSLTTSRKKMKEVEVTQFIATFEWGLNQGVKKA